jgi:hypothetical protein
LIKLPKFSSNLNLKLETITTKREDS